MNELEQLTRLCEKLGARPAQAATMAAQLLKRAAQVAAERGITREAALQGLIEVVVKGRAGEVPSHLPPRPPPASRSPGAADPPA
jgi:hypothetical protein